MQAGATRYGIPVDDAPGWQDALAHMLDESGQVHAWLVNDPLDGVVGYIKGAPGVDGTVRVASPESWASIADSLGLIELPSAAPQPDAAEGLGAAAGEPTPGDGGGDGEPTTEGGPRPPVPPQKKPPEGKVAPSGPVITPADYEEQTGIMVALMVPEGDAQDISIDVPAAEDPTNLHLTLAFLGAVDTVDDEGAFYAKVLDALRDTAAEYQPISGTVCGIGRVSIDGGEDAFVYLFDSPELSELRQDVVEDLEEQGITASDEHGFIPHITIAYLKAGEDNPVRRAEPKVLTFDALTFCYGDQRLNIKLGGVDPDEADAGSQMDAVNGYVFTPDTTAPGGLPDGKAMPPQFRKGPKGRSGKKGPPIAPGSFVAWGSAKGRVDLVVTNGKVPGVEEDITGSAASPAVRVVVWSQGPGGKWTATGRKVGVAMSSLKRTLPLTFSGKKDLDPEEALVEVLTGYFEAVAETKDLPFVDPTAVRTVYDRGLESWPGDQVGVEREQWALGRTKAFLRVAAGRTVPGYEADRDLLPDGHALAATTAPMLTVDGGSQETEEKVAIPLAEGETLDAETLRGVLDELRAAAAEQH